MHDSPTPEELEEAARIKRAEETGGIHCNPSAAPTREERGVIGPNQKKLIMKRIAAVMIPEGGGVMDGILALTNPDKLSRITKESTEWISQMLEAVKAAPDNPYGNDNEVIAAAILKQME
jgi:hypothetical protein